MDVLAIISYRMIPAWVLDGKVQSDTILTVYFHNHHIVMALNSDQEAEVIIKELDIVTDKSLPILDKVQRIKHIKFIHQEGKI
jgi:UDP-N-acetyl-D-mannosaminuronic acid transferase (WecB/TagA/CpsF family)